MATQKLGVLFIQHRLGIEILNILHGYIFYVESDGDGLLSYVFCQLEISMFIFTSWRLTCVL